MARFLSCLHVQLVAEPISTWGRATWRLTAPLIYQSERYAQVIEVPAGYETDFASVPRLPLSWLLTGDTVHSAAVVHDYLYHLGMSRRSICDAIFREAMRATGVPAWRAWLMWMAVRLWGWMFWASANP